VDGKPNEANVGFFLAIVNKTKKLEVDKKCF
jgi:hypothetical protein